MYSEKDYKELSQEWIDDVAFIAPGGNEFFEPGVLLDLLWKAYEQGYQDRIDDYDGAEDTTEQDE